MLSNLSRSSQPELEPLQESHLKPSAKGGHIKTLAKAAGIKPSPMSTQDNGSGESTTMSKTSQSRTTSLTQSIEKLHGSMATGQNNYNAWRFTIIRILKEKDVLEAIEESTTPVGTAKDDQAFTIISLNIKDSQIPHI